MTRDKCEDQVGASRFKTLDLMGRILSKKKVLGDGIEPSTFGSTIRRSNQLSYPSDSGKRLSEWIHHMFADRRFLW